MGAKVWAVESSRPQLPQLRDRYKLFKPSSCKFKQHTSNPEETGQSDNQHLLGLLLELNGTVSGILFLPN